MPGAQNESAREMPPLDEEAIDAEMLRLGFSGNLGRPDGGEAPKKKPKRKMHPFIKGLLRVLVTVVITLGVVALIGWLVILPQINSFVRKLGLDDINELMSVYKEFTKKVDPDKIVFNGFDRENARVEFNSAKNKLSGYDVFSGGELDPDKMDKIELSAPIRLTDREFASLIDSASKNPEFYSKIGIPLLKDLTIDMLVYEFTVKPSTAANAPAGSFDVRAVGKADISDYVNDLGFLAGLLPGDLWIVSSYTVAPTGLSFGEGDSYEVFTHSININNMSTKAHNSIIKVLRTILEQKDNADFNLEYVSLGSAENINKYCEKFAAHINCAISYGNNEVIFTPFA